jgi:hypothetical protein
MDAAALNIDALGEDGLGPGEGDREGSRDEYDELGVFWPDEKDDRERVRKNGDVVDGSGIPSSSAYRS